MEIVLGRFSKALNRLSRLSLSTLVGRASFNRHSIQLQSLIPSVDTHRMTTYSHSSSLICFFRSIAQRSSDALHANTKVTSSSPRPHNVFRSAKDLKSHLWSDSWITSGSCQRNLVSKFQRLNRTA
jgi:hypothetical protein